MLSQTSWVHAFFNSVCIPWGNHQHKILPREPLNTELLASPSASCTLEGKITVLEISSFEYQSHAGCPCVMASPGRWPLWYGTVHWPKQPLSSSDLLCLLARIHQEQACGILAFPQRRRECGGSLDSYLIFNNSSRLFLCNLALITCDLGSGVDARGWEDYATMGKDASMLDEDILAQLL